MTEPIKTIVVTPKNWKEHAKKLALFWGSWRVDWREPSAESVKELVKYYEQHPPENKVWIIAEVGKQPIGFIRMKIENRKAITGWVEVKPEYLGLRLGRKLETKAFYYCRNHGLKWEPLLIRAESLHRFRAALERTGSLGRVFTKEAIKAKARVGAEFRKQKLPKELKLLRKIEKKDRLKIMRQ